MKLLRTLLIVFVCLIPPCFALKQCTGGGPETEQPVYTEGTITNREAITHPSGDNSSGYVEYILTLDKKTVKTVTKDTYMTSSIGDKITLVGKEEIRNSDTKFYSLMVILTVLEICGFLAYGLYRVVES